MNLRKLSLASLIMASLPMAVSADEGTGNGPVGTSATADLEFEVIIPAFVYFRVGTAVAGTVDTVTFDLQSAGLESGSGTDPADVDVDVELRTNADVRISASALTDSGPLAPGAGDISVSSSNAAEIPAPDFGLSTADVLGGVNNTAVWTFSYDNSTVHAPGTYTSVVTYTALTL